MTAQTRLIGAALASTLWFLGGCILPPPQSGSVTYQSQPADTTITYEAAPVDASWTYYPESDVYYSTNRSVYCYQDPQNAWIYSRQAPPHARHGSLGARVSVTYVGARPYDHYAEHRRGHGPPPRRGNASDNDRRGDDDRGDGRHYNDRRGHDDRGDGRYDNDRR